MTRKDEASDNWRKGYRVSNSAVRYFVVNDANTTMCLVLNDNRYDLERGRVLDY